MKVLLVQPPIEDFYDTSIRTFPLGLLYIGTRVSSIAEVTIFDARTGKKRHIAKNPFPELNPFYQEGIYTPFSFFSRYTRFGLSYDEILQAIERERPDVVGIASMCSAYERLALETAKAAKQVNQDIITVMGGIHASTFPERMLESRDVDYCIRGEGETPFFELITCLISGKSSGIKHIPGVCYRDGSRLHVAPYNVETDINLIPDRRLVDTSRYCIGRKKYTFFLTSRGCPFSCGFCSKPPVPYRKRTIDQIESEIEDCRALGIEAVDFEDDMLNLDARFFSSVLDAFSGLNFTLSAMNGIYPNTVNPETMRHMYRAGFRRLNFSLVDIAGLVLARQNRSSQRSFLEILPYLESSPFLVEVHFIIGLPGQDPDQLLDTLRFLMERRLLLGPSIFYMAPGSALCEDSEGSRAVPLEAMRSSFMLPFNSLFQRPVTFAFVKLVRFINYIKQTIDREEGMTRLSELTGLKRTTGDPRDASIIDLLLKEKTFYCYDTQKQEMRREPVLHSLIQVFFDKAKDGRIKGYKSNRSIVVDV